MPLITHPCLKFDLGDIFNLTGTKLWTPAGPCEIFNFSSYNYKKDFQMRWNMFKSEYNSVHAEFWNWHLTKKLRSFRFKQVVKHYCFELGKTSVEIKGDSNSSAHHLILKPSWPNNDDKSRAFMAIGPKIRFFLPKSRNTRVCIEKNYTHFK